MILLLVRRSMFNVRRSTFFCVFYFLLSNIAFAEIFIPARIYPWKAWEGPGTENQTVGVMGGIPTRETIFVNLRTTEDGRYFCTANGVDNDAFHIQNAIEDCPPGQVVYAPAGDYALANTVAIGMNHSNWVLRGDGPTTIFKRTGNGAAFTIGSGGALGNFRGVLSGGTRGSTSIQVNGEDLPPASDTYFPGNIIVFICTNAPFAHEFAGTYRHTLGWLMEIMSVTDETATDEDTITFRSPLPMDIMGLGPNVGNYSTITAHTIGLENFAVDNSAQSGTTPILMFNVRGSWIKGLDTYSGLRHLYFDSVIHTELRRNKFHDSRQGGSGTEGVSFANANSWNLVEDNIFDWVGAVALIFGEGGQFIGANVAGYNHFVPGSNAQNSVTNSADISLSHGGNPSFILVEGNVFGRIEGSDGYGSASHNTIFRNRITITHRTPTVNLHFRGVDFNKCTNWYNVVGNSLGTPAFAGVLETEARDYETGGPYPLIRRLGYWQLGSSCYGLYGDGPGIGCTENISVGCRDILVAAIPPATPDYSTSSLGFGNCGVTNYDDGETRLDKNVRATLAWHGNWDAATDGLLWETTNVNVTDYTDQTIPTSLYTTKAGLVARGVVMGALELPMINPENIGTYNETNDEMLSAASYRYFNDGDDPPEETPTPRLYLFRH